MLEHYSTLVDCPTLAAQLHHPDWVVIDCRFDLKDTRAGARAYASGHIPGAHYAHLDHVLSSPMTPGSGRHPLPNAAKLMLQLGFWGINTHTQVIAYDDCGGSIAARLWWLMRWLGHERVAVLDGGWSKWLREAWSVTTAQPPINQGRYPGRVNDALWLDSDAVARWLEQPTAILIDVRDPPRFRGETEPLDPVAGHIPGAINLPLTKNLDADGHFLNADALRKLYLDALGDRVPADGVLMCGSGVTACHSLLAMQHAGLPGARLYAGSWSEWLRDPARPVATGA